MDNERSSHTDQPFITGIYNYCDRWCERCPLTSFCLLNALEHAEHRNSPGFLDRLETRLDLLSDLMVLLNGEKRRETGARCLASIGVSSTPYDLGKRALVDRVHDYVKAVNGWLDSNWSFLDAVDRLVEKKLGQDDSRHELEESVVSPADALEEIAWYRILIPSKLIRALSAFDQEDWTGSAEQPDADGSAKVALIGIERSRRAWERVASADGDLQCSVGQILAQLDELEQSIEEQFPAARSFRRPGFDSAMNPRIHSG